jgi:hypothetical protein
MYKVMEVLILKRKLDRVAPTAYEENRHEA